MKIALHLARTTRTLLTLGLLLTAVALTAARFWLLPEVDAYRQSLQSLLSRSLGQPLRIGGLSAHMRGFFPELVLRDVAVVDGASGAVDLWLGQVYLGLDLPGWLASGEWRTGWIALQGADLALHRQADGNIVLEGVRSGGEVPPWLFGYGRFELLDSRLRWSDDVVGGPAMEFAKADLSIANDGEQHHLAVQLAPAGDGNSHLQLVADLAGDMAKPAQLAGRAYLEGRQIRAEAWPLPAVGGYALRSGVADFRLWLDWHEGRLQQLAGRVALARPLLAGELAHEPLPGGAARHGTQLAMQGLDGWFRWRRAERGWSLEAGRLRPNVAGEPWPESRFSLAYGEGSIRAAADYLRLDDVSTLLHALAPTLPAEDVQALDGLGVRGELRDLRLVYGPGAEGQAHYGVCTSFTGFGVNVHGNLPGLTGLGGQLCGDDQEAVADLAAGPGTVDLPQWFRAPLEYTRAAGRLRWRRDGGGWALHGDGLRIETPVAALSSRFRLAKPADDASPWLDWRAQVEGGDMRRISAYLPARIMPEATVAWLDGAFLDGRVTRGEITLRGPLAAFPFNGGEGRFQARADVADARLRFAGGWQPLTDLSAHLQFDGDSLEVLGGHGRLGETSASDVTVRIDHMAPDGDLLVTGRVGGSLSQSLDYFAHSPKSALVETLRAQTETEGRADVDLLLGYGFDDEAVRVRGEVRISEGRLRSPSSGVALEALSGVVRFNDSRIASDALRAQWLGAPVNLNLSGDGIELAIAASGRTGVERLREQFAASGIAGEAAEGARAGRPPEAWGRLSGKLGYRAELSLPQDFTSAGSAVRLDVSADLSAASVDLPPPFGKAVGEAGSARLELAWQEKGGLAVRGDYNGKAKLQTRLAKEAAGHWAAEVGEVALGDVPLGELPAHGWRVAGKLDAVPLDAWWQRLTAAPVAMAYGGKIHQVDLSVTRPSWEGRDWGALSVSLKRVADGWDGYWESAFATGALRLPPSWPADAPVRLDLERIVLPDLPKETLERARQTQLDPARLPALAIRSQHVLWRGYDLGLLDCAVERRPTGMRLKRCDVTSDWHHTTLEGEWSRVGAKDFSRLDGKMKAKDLGKLLGQLGLGDEVAETPARLTFSLQWPDAPQRVTASKLGGDLAVKLGEGSLRHVDPGVGRALGLFNIETLKRRLLLDFSDVFEESLAYDKVRGEFKITDGVADTRNLLIDGPSARVFISGKTDLANHTLDQLVTVVPRTSLAWPIVGTLAGGPAVGGAVFLVQQLVGEKLEGITASQYTVKGSWDDPAVVLVSRNMPLDLLQRAWQGMKDISGLTAEPEENNE